MCKYFSLDLKQNDAAIVLLLSIGKYLLTYRLNPLSLKYEGMDF
jgi:hypothetical protein